MEEIASVYARSLFEVALEHDKLDVVREQLGQIADAISEDRELQVFFFSPYFSTEEKKEGLAKVIQGAEPAVLNFLELLVEKHRTPALFRIRNAYDELWEHENKLLPVEITSAIELDDQIAQRIGDQIGEQTGQRVELTKTVDPDIIGGLVLRVGNSILDASIRNRLDNLRKNVAKAA
jgi:F-type H+-transporting ATPase subunit delta